LLFWAHNLLSQYYKAEYRKSDLLNSTRRLPPGGGSFYTWNKIVPMTTMNISVLGFYFTVVRKIKKRLTTPL